jgi:hypothetical protein
MHIVNDQMSQLGREHLLLPAFLSKFGVTTLPSLITPIDLPGGAANPESSFGPAVAPSVNLEALKYFLVVCERNAFAQITPLAPCFQGARIDIGFA